MCVCAFIVVVVIVFVVVVVVVVAGAVVVVGGAHINTAYLKYIPWETCKLLQPLVLQCFIRAGSEFDITAQCIN